MRWRVVAAVMVASFVGACGDTGPPPGRSPQAAMPTTTTAAAPTTTTAPARLAGTARLVVDTVPDQGFVVVDGDALVVTDDTGTVIANGESGGFSSNDRGHPLALTVDGDVVTVQEVPRAPFVSDQFPSDCEAEFVGGAPNVARCGAGRKPRRIDVADRSRRVRTLIEAPAPGRDDVLGHWRSAQLSPDAEWVLALWSGECESPTTFLLRYDGGRATTVDGTALRSWVEAPASHPVGWTSDGRARFVVGAGACGTGWPDRGVYAVAPGSGTRSLLYKATSDHPSAYAWVKQGSGR